MNKPNEFNNIGNYLVETRNFMTETKSIDIAFNCESEFKAMTQANETLMASHELTNVKVLQGHDGFIFEFTFDNGSIVVLVKQLHGDTYCVYEDSLSDEDESVNEVTEEPTATPNSEPVQSENVTSVNAQVQGQIPNTNPVPVVGREYPPYQVPITQPVQIPTNPFPEEINRAFAEAQQSDGVLTSIFNQQQMQSRRINESRPPLNPEYNVDVIVSDSPNIITTGGNDPNDESKKNLTPQSAT